MIRRLVLSLVTALLVAACRDDGGGGRPTVGSASRSSAASSAVVLTRQVQAWSAACSSLPRNEGAPPICPADSLGHTASPVTPVEFCRGLSSPELRTAVDADVFGVGKGFPTRAGVECTYGTGNRLTPLGATLSVHVPYAAASRLPLADQFCEDLGTSRCRERTDGSARDPLQVSLAGGTPVARIGSATPRAWVQVSAAMATDDLSGRTAQAMFIDAARRLAVPAP
ncbi:hypothetical protein SAMN05443575_3639 [Jatrophihabitans endophyticus]|uniref:DUF3558 domain-containing protein n=1 Tax=Jatrophihabitans endophyticus TaxID=1206085 RepID=A0A1M5RSY1_9ACTN|nr:hypothetical protein [Jatrophihabitans endophyticus]SHH29397.1 hypothetical protein SAMN05443575_3639 [Jatrophihabitans endophyticus]